MRCLTWPLLSRTRSRFRSRALAFFLSRSLAVFLSRSLAPSLSLSLAYTHKHVGCDHINPDVL